MWKSRIAALLVVIAALVTVDLLVRWASPAQAASGQVVPRPERFVSVGLGDGLIVRMTESGVVDIYSWVGGTAHASHGFPYQQWVPLP